MQDKAALLVEETGCELAEAELALELCAYDLQAAVQAIPRLFQNILVLKGRLFSPGEPFYGLWLVILNLKDRSLLRARAVVSYNPAVFSCDLEAHWFDFEGRLYACRLWAGALPDFSQEVEHRLADFFSSEQGARFYSEKPRIGAAEIESLRACLPSRLGETQLQVRPELLDMGQFQEVRPPGLFPPDKGARGRSASRSSAGPLVLSVELEADAQGVAAAKVRAGDVVFAKITDGRDVAQYLAKLFSTRVGAGAVPLPAHVEVVECGPEKVFFRLRFSAGLCGDAVLAPDARLRVRRKAAANNSWWRKILGGFQ